MAKTCPDCGENLETLKEYPTDCSGKMKTTYICYCFNCKHLVEILGCNKTTWTLGEYESIFNENPFEPYYDDDDDYSYDPVDYFEQCTTCEFNDDRPDCLYEYCPYIKH